MTLLHEFMRIIYEELVGYAFLILLILYASL